MADCAALTFFVVLYWEKETNRGNESMDVWMISPQRHRGRGEYGITTFVPVIPSIQCAAAEGGRSTEFR
jgi:hypothetical protein